MDRETLKRMKEAQAKAAAAQARAKKARDPKNKEYWEEKLKGMEDFKIKHFDLYTDACFLVGCYKEKIKTFK